MPSGGNNGGDDSNTKQFKWWMIPRDLWFLMPEIIKAVGNSMEIAAIILLVLLAFMSPPQPP
jgi:hypothetical protein